MNHLKHNNIYIAVFLIIFIYGAWKVELLPVDYRASVKASALCRRTVWKADQVSHLQTSSPVVMILYISVYFTSSRHGCQISKWRSTTWQIREDEFTSASGKVLDQMLFHLAGEHVLSSTWERTVRYTERHINEVTQLTHTVLLPLLYFVKMLIKKLSFTHQ